MARRSGLGRGLSALVPTEVTGDRSSPLREVPIASISPNPRQPRSSFDEEGMAMLATSIKELGLLQPVLVRPVGDGEEEFELIAGERRWRAARRAGLQTIPVLVQRAGDANSLEQALVENLHRQDLGVLEEAAAYQQLIDEFGYTHEQVAARVGKSRVAVTNTLRLLQLPAGVQRLLTEGRISAGHARALLGTPDRAFQEELARTVASEGLSVRTVEELVRERSGPAGPTPVPAAPAEPAIDGGAPAAGPVPPRSVPRLPPAGILELEELLSNHLNTRVKVDMSAKRGRVVVEFATLEDLERIYKLMTGTPQAYSGTT